MNFLVCLTTHTIREGKGKGRRTNKQDEDQTRPATHRPNSCGTKDTEGQRTLRDKGH